jgi:dihydrodipicolinate synthase/N-acetylneuraminate lyase
MTAPWKGIFVIVVTPFTDTFELDEASLRKEIRFCIEAGAAGLVGPANASEFSLLSEAERKRWLEIVVSEAGGSIPVVATTTGSHAHMAVEMSRFAQKIGADGIMAMPPHVVHVDQQGCYDYFQSLAQAVHIPICIQNYPPPLGTPMSSQLLARMCREMSQVQYIKEETLIEPRQLSLTIEIAGDACRGVFGGQGGIYLIDEFNRGAVGNMPACQTADVMGRIWKLLEVGDEAGARRVFNQLLPLINYERLYGVTVYKEVLYRRGIFATQLSRYPGSGLDDSDRVEFESIMRDVEPLFTV